MKDNDKTMKQNTEATENNIICKEITEYKICKERDFNLNVVGIPSDVKDVDNIYKFLLNVLDYKVFVAEKVLLILLDEFFVIKGVVAFSANNIGEIYKDPKIVSKYIVDTLADNIIIVISHPTEKLKVTDDDLKFTAHVKHLCRIFKIRLYNSVVFSLNKHKIILEEADKYYNYFL